MMTVSWESGDGVGINGPVNYMLATRDNLALYAEIAVPEGASDDYGYMTLKQEILRMAEMHGYGADCLEFWYGDGTALEHDADADGTIYTEDRTEE